MEASWDPIYRTVVGKLAEVAKIQDTTTADDNKTIIFSPTILAFVLELSTHSLDNHYTKQDLGEVVNSLNTYARYKYRETALRRRGEAGKTAQMQLQPRKITYQKKITYRFLI